MTQRTALVLSILFLWGSAPVCARAEAPAWTVDKAHSRIGFSVSHLGINTVHGVFSKFDAEISADADGKLGAVSATVVAKSIDTDIEKRDEHLRSPELFDVDRHPHIALKADKIAWSNKRFSGTASLTIKGKTLPVKYQGEMTGSKTVNENGKPVVRVGYTVTAKIDRTKFGLTFGGLSEGLGMVGETVTITLNIELNRPQ